MSDATEAPDIDSHRQPGLSRRTLIVTGAASALVGAGVGVGATTLVSRVARPAPEVWLQSGAVGAPRIAGLHLQFGSDASSEMVASWQTVDPVQNPRVMLGTPDGGFGRTVAAQTRTYRDAMSKGEVRVHHARLDRLDQDTRYVYAAVHDGASAEVATFRTAPRGRAPLRFTSFGDQATPTLNLRDGKEFTSDNHGSPAAADVTSGVERLDPLFNLVNGDLCYANLSGNRIRTWSDWFENNTRSARYRAWMPAAGNHENELGNGPVGYGAYQTYFDVPDSGADADLQGLWYAFTAGSVRVVSVNNDDVYYQDGGNSYVRGYSGGAQKRWLESELSAAQSDSGIDWIVVCMHQTAVSTADRANGADLGIRENWLPLFDRFGVDLVVCGHEHHYERSHPIRGAELNQTLTPIPAENRTDVIDATKGTVHLVIGGGGSSITSNGLLFAQPRCRVLTGVGKFDPAERHKVPIYVPEEALWSAFRDRAHPYGFVSLDVDPGNGPAAATTIAATYYAVDGPYATLTAVDRFMLTKRRADGAQ